ncbi:MAG TPA: TonB-dependent receptor [Chitinophagaceae bacterium]|nr:TonB-dependent receptor [Chitinophagaceae bacterium]
MKKVIIFLILILGVIQTYAQDTSRSLDEVVVTAEKTRVKQSLTGQVVAVITSRELRENEGKSLGQILNFQPGITISGAESAPGTNQYVFTRGAADGYTMILLDGVVVYDASQITSHFDFNLIPVDMIDHIEIIRGAGSTLYGSGAVAGVINIITKKGGKKPFGATASMTGGSYGTFKENAGIYGHSDKISYNVMLTNLDSRGFPGAVDTTGTGHFTNDGLHDKSVNVNLGFKVGPKLDLMPFLRYSDEHANIPEGAYTDAKNYTYYTHYLQGGIQGTVNLSRSVLHLIYSYGYTHRGYLDDSSSIKSSYYQESDISHMHDGEAYLNARISRQVSLLAGFQELYTSTEQSSLSISSYGPYSSSLSPDSARTSLSSVYLSLFLKNDSGFNLIAGGRLNEHSQYGFNPTFTINPFYSFAGHQKIFVNIASTFNAPSLYQLYSPYGSRSLKPEKGMSYEAGYESLWMNNRLKFRVTGFIRDMKDVIAFTNAYINFNQQHDRGGEVEIDYEAIPGLNLKGYYAYVSGNVTAPGNGKADTTYDNLYRRPENSFGMHVGWQVCPVIFVGSDLKYTGGRSDLDFSNYPATSVELNPYWLWNIHLDWTPLRAWKVFADLDNITNSRYEEILGYATRKFNLDAGLQWTL